MQDYLLLFLYHHDQTSDVDESDESDDPDYVPMNSDTESHDSEYDSEFQLTDDSEYDSPEEYL